MKVCGQEEVRTRWKVVEGSLNLEINREGSTRERLKYAREGWDISRLHLLHIFLLSLILSIYHHLSIFLSVYLSIVYLSVYHLCICLSNIFCLSFYLSICLLSTYLFICLQIYLSIWHFIFVNLPNLIFTSE